MIKPFSQAPHRGSVGESVRHQFEIYSCQETGCVLTFKTQAEADNHMDTGKHRLEVDCESTYDRVRRKWAAIGPLHDPVTWYGINYTGTQITQWDFQNKGTHTSPARLSFVLKVPLRNLRPSVIYSVPRDRIVQRAYCDRGDVCS